MRKPFANYLPASSELVLRERALQNVQTIHWKVRVSFFAIYVHSNEIHNVAALVKCLLVLRIQLYMFRTVTVHPQELLCRYCMCRLWYVVRNALPDTSRWYNVLPKTLYQPAVSAHTIVCTYSIYKEAPEDGPLLSETCRADT